MRYLSKKSCVSSAYQCRSVEPESELGDLRDEVEESVVADAGQLFVEEDEAEVDQQAEPV